MSTVFNHCVIVLLILCRCQEVLLDNMHLGDNIARNAALRENVFMMAICIELRIPLFLVGKPGSSKSLAKAIVSESMRGKDSRNELLTNFKEVSLNNAVLVHSGTPKCGPPEIWTPSLFIQPLTLGPECL